MMLALQQLSPWLPAELPGWWPELSTFTSMDWLGLLALAVLWTNMLLVAAAAALEARRLLERRARLARGLIRARVTRGDGPDGALAQHVVAQVGRTRGDGLIHFHDRGVSVEVFGGELEVLEARPGCGAPGERARVDASGTVADVWPAAGAVERAGVCPGPDAFAAAEGPARKARGWARALTTTLREGDEVWLLASRVDGSSGATYTAPHDGPLFISGVDPTPWLTRHALFAAGFAALSVLLTLICSAVALWPPIYGTVSTIGAFSGIVLWLSFLPLGTAVRDAVREPGRAFVRGVWRR